MHFLLVHSLNLRPETGAKYAFSFIKFELFAGRTMVLDWILPREHRFGKVWEVTRISRHNTSFGVAVCIFFRLTIKIIRRRA